MPHIEERDSKTGRIVKPAGDYAEVLKQGRLYNWAGPLRRMCAKCRRTAMKDSKLCCWHDPEHRKNRTKIAFASNAPNRIIRATEREHRSTMGKVWYRDPWFNGATIWFAPQIEQEFRVAAANVALPLETISPWSADVLRWQWHYSRLDPDNWAAWQQAAARGRNREHKIGPPPPDWVHEPPGRYPPGVGSPIVQVACRVPLLLPRGTSKRWTGKMKAVFRAVAAAGRTGAAESAEQAARVEQFLAQHQRDLREIYRRLGDAASDQAVRNRLARAYAIILRGEAAGYQALHRLFREVEQGARRW